MPKESLLLILSLILAVDFLEGLHFETRVNSILFSRKHSSSVEIFRMIYRVIV